MAPTSIGAIAETLNHKTDADLGNITDVGKSLISGLSMSSDRYISLTLGTSGSTYTMTKNGCIALSATFNTDGVIYVYRSKAPRYGVSTRYIANQWVDICLNAKKDDVITIQYSGSATVHSFNLIYAEGEK